MLCPKPSPWCTMDAAFDGCAVPLRNLVCFSKAWWFNKSAPIHGRELNPRQEETKRKKEKKRQGGISSSSSDCPFIPGPLCLLMKRTFLIRPSWFYRDCSELLPVPQTLNVPSLQETVAVPAAFSLYEPDVEHADMSISRHAKRALPLINISIASWMRRHRPWTHYRGLIVDKIVAIKWLPWWVSSAACSPSVSRLAVSKRLKTFIYSSW